MRKTVTDSMQGEAFGVQRDGMGHDPLRQGLSCAEDVACHPPWWRRYWPLILLVCMTFAWRALHFGNPDMDYDEDFYLLVGDRMLHGAVPYVDIWDRKPVGLFLIYALARLAGGEGFTQYLALAACFAAFNACMLWLIVRRWVGRWSAILPAVTYVLWCELYLGGGGQAAIFYNCFTITGFWLVLRARDAGQWQRTVWLGMATMVLMGLALQIKYTVLPEGVFFGCAFLWLLRRQGAAWATLVLAGAAMVMLALLPTVLAMAWYWQHGYLSSFAYANFVSALARGHLGGWVIRQSLMSIFKLSLPLSGAAAFGLWKLFSGVAAERRDAIWLAGWLTAALFGFAMIGNFYFHYFMSVIPVLALISGATLRDRRLGALMYAALLGWPFILGLAPWPDDGAERARATRQLTEIIMPHIDDRHCLYVFDGISTLYLTTHSCLPTPYVYPDHLTNAVEARAIGVDPERELRRILANRPGAIVTATPQLGPLMNEANVRMMEQALARDYVPVGGVKEGKRQTTVWALRGGPGSKNLPSWPQGHAVRLYDNHAS